MITEAEFNHRIAQDFNLTYRIYKEKLAYWMVQWADGSDGSVAGPFAGHGHNCRLASFEYKGWAYALNTDGNWYLLRDGQSGWRQKGTDNPFPQCPEDANLDTW